MQTQIFHTLYHTHENVLLGSPTGSGKTVAAELAMWQSLRDHPGSKIVYIAPMKALVRERVLDWRGRLTQQLGLKLVELTGDNTPDTRTIRDADIIITTPEKWGRYLPFLADTIVCSSSESRHHRRDPSFWAATEDPFWKLSSVE